MRSRQTPLVPFFLLSLGLHLSLLFFWPAAAQKKSSEDLIPVAFLKAPEKKGAPPAEKPRPIPTRPSKEPAEIAKKTTPLPEQPAKAPVSKDPIKGPAREIIKEEPDESPARERTIIARRPLPTMKELLPPVVWSPSRERPGREGAVRLDTREPKYISYFASIKRAIELVWEYPEPALRYGVEGKLVLEFTVLADGTLERARLLRSSGYSVLDEEAMRAVRAAAPFHPIPSWIGKARLDIVASFEYHDNRIRHGFTP